MHVALAPACNIQCNYCNRKYDCSNESRPAKTFDTLRRLQKQAPDLKLCISTNGLALPDHVDGICKYNVDHVTINRVDPAAGEKMSIG